MTRMKRPDAETKPPKQEAHDVPEDGPADLADLRDPARRFLQ